MWKGRFDLYPEHRINVGTIDVSYFLTSGFSEQGKLKGEVGDLSPNTVQCEHCHVEGVLGERLQFTHYTQSRSCNYVVLAALVRIRVSHIIVRQLETDAKNMLSYYSDMT